MRWLITSTSAHAASFVKDLRAAGQRVVGVVSRNKERARIFATENNIANYEYHYEVDFDYDAAYICNPNGLHHETASIFLERSKHVLVEKLMTGNYKDTLDLFELAERKGVKIIEGYAHITNPRIIKHKQLGITGIKADIKKDLLSTKKGADTKSAFKAIPQFRRDMDGGALKTLGCYPISYAVTILGRMREVVVNDVEYINGIDAMVDLTITFEKGILNSVVSLKEDGDCGIYVKDEKIEDSVHLHDEPNRMVHEIRELVLGKDLNRYKRISLEVARIIDVIIDQIWK